MLVYEDGGQRIGQIVPNVLGSWERWLDSVVLNKPAIKYLYQIFVLIKLVFNTIFCSIEVLEMTPAMRLATYFSVFYERGPNLAKLASKYSKREELNDVNNNKYNILLIFDFIKIKSSAHL